MESMDFPQLLFCTTGGFKSEVLIDAGLRDESLKLAQFVTYWADRNLTDIQQLWYNATYSAEEFAVTWIALEGNTQSSHSGNVYSKDLLCSENGGSPIEDNRTAVMEETNSLANGKCWLWTSKLKGRKRFPDFNFFIETPPNE